MQRHQNPNPKTHFGIFNRNRFHYKVQSIWASSAPYNPHPQPPKIQTLNPQLHGTKQKKKPSPNYRPQHYSSKSQLTKKRRKLLAFFCFACSSTVRLVPRPEFFSPKLTKPRKPRNQKHLNMPPRDQISASMHQSWLHYKAQIPIQNQPRRELKHKQPTKAIFFFLPDNKLLITVQKHG